MKKKRNTKVSVRQRQRNKQKQSVRVNVHIDQSKKVRRGGRVQAQAPIYFPTSQPTIVQVRPEFLPVNSMASMPYRDNSSFGAAPVNPDVTMGARTPFAEVPTQKEKPRVNKVEEEESKDTTPDNSIPESFVPDTDPEFDMGSGEERTTGGTKRGPTNPLRRERKRHNHSYQSLFRAWDKTRTRTRRIH
jgi:hypothetical protein